MQQKQSIVKFLSTKAIKYRHSPPRKQIFRTEYGLFVGIEFWTGCFLKENQDITEKIIFSFGV